MGLRSWMLKPLLGLGVFALAGAYFVLEAAPAEARTFVSLGISVPVYAGPAYYAPPTYYYYPPPPVVYAPPPAVVYAPPPAASPGPTCREYRSTSTLDGRPQEVIGTACRQPDGSWRIIN